MKRGVVAIVIVTASLWGCEPEATDTRPRPARMEAAPTPSEAPNIALPRRHDLAKSLGELYTIKKFEVRQPPQDDPDEVLDVIAHWEGPGHRRWRFTFEQWADASEAASEFEEEAAAAGADTAVSVGRRSFCGRESSGANYCTTVFRNITLRVIALQGKDPSYYPPVEVVTEVVGAAARVFRDGG